MLREYEIENFKAFTDPAKISIRPITLIFGANSSGKSAILQSLLMLKQTLAESGGSSALSPKGSLVDLGSFREFVHGHDVKSQFSFKMTLDAPKVLYEGSGLDPEITDLLNDETDRLQRSIDFDSIGFKVHFSGDEYGSVASKLELFLGQDPKSIIAYSRGPLADIPVIEEDTWKSVLKAYKVPKSISKKVSEKLKEMIKSKYSEYVCDCNYQHPYWRRYSRKFAKKEISVFDTITLKAFLPELLNGRQLKHIISSYYNPDSENAGHLSLFTLCAGNLVKRVLGGIDYIPPLRGYPKRFYSAGDNGEIDALLNSDKSELYLSAINVMLEKMGINYDAEVIQYFDGDRLGVDLYGLQLINRTTYLTTSLKDVGFGVSQVLPIVFKSLLKVLTLILIEQPELHLHPALQAELGDLFIESAKGIQKNTFVIETHSEHLLLRIMRRIRETTLGKLREGSHPITPADVSVLFVEPDGSRSIVREMPLNDRGDLVKAWPGGFFEEGFREIF